MTDHAVTIERTVDAPIALLWELWTRPEHFGAWYGPDGARLPVVEMDVRAGGRRHFCMEMDTPDGPMRMWFVGEYREVSPTTRLVYTENMSNENGDVLTPADMGMPGDHPATTEVTVELEDRGDQTHMVMTHVGIPADSPGAMGWRMAIDALVDRAAALTDDA